MSQAHADANKRVLDGLPHVMPDALKHSRTEWRSSNIMRQVLIFEMGQKIEQARNELETCSIDKVAGLQAKVQTIREMQALINSQEHK